MTEIHSPNPASSQSPEPWLRGTRQEVPAVHRAVLHALDLANEDLHRWCANLTDKELNTAPLALPSISFHLQHIGRSLDRLLTYAEGHILSAQQLANLKTEAQPSAHEPLFNELAAALTLTTNRILALANADLEQPRTVGKKSLPTTVAGLLIHVADHTQRHVGQAITTAKLISNLKR
jgi:uncharacterized damage-inducible protein DinB